MAAERTRRLTTALLFALGLSLGATFLLQEQIFGRIDLLVYDTLIRWQFRDPLPNIVIAAIDEKSLRELGRWPWSRRIHARLLQQLERHGVRAVAFDILMPEPQASDPEADRLLAAALARSGHTVLAVAPEQGEDGGFIAESLPIPDLAAAAAGLGHVDVELDVDGLCRSVYLHAGLGSPHWPALGLALVHAAFPDRNPGLSSERRPRVDRAAHLGLWVRDQRILIPFVGPTGRFRRISYVDILDARIPAGSLRDRVVLVGATAAGLGDALATPASLAHDRMPGVELNANIVNALLEGKAIVAVSRHSYFAATLLAVFLGVTVLAWPVRNGLLVVLGATTAMLAFSGILLLVFHLWFPPAVAMAMLVLSFPLWSWLQHHAESRALQRLRQNMEHHVRHDPVTDLPNLEGLREHLQRAIESQGAQPGTIGVMAIRLERLGTTGEGLGLSGSDRLVTAMARRLRTAVREADFVAHMNGIDFAVVIDHGSDVQVVEAAARRLYETFQRPLTSDGTECYLSPRIGVSLYSSDGVASDTLIDNAYCAMYKAREDGAKGLRYFSAGLRDELHSRSRLENLLQSALQRGELELYYQPQVTANDGGIVGVEALLRWNSPQLGQVGPGQFIPVAERTGSILPIGTWVLEQACHQVRSWTERGLGTLRVAVNLSPEQFVQDDLVDQVTGILEKTGVPARQLELEVTEGALMHDMDTAVWALGELKRHGVNIAIDDFGTGYSSLSYLKQLPLDRLKIDRSFIVEIGRSTDSSEITQAIIAMAHRLKLKVIAEGVENDHQVGFLRTHGCDELQGYLYGTPVPASEMERWLVGPGRGSEVTTTRPVVTMSPPPAG